jgi:hypothetical protein
VSPRNDTYSWVSAVISPNLAEIVPVISLFCRYLYVRRRQQIEVALNEATIFLKENDAHRILSTHVLTHNCPNEDIPKSAGAIVPVNLASIT